MTLLAPWFLALSALVPVALWLRHRGSAPAVDFGPGSFLEGLPGSWRSRLRHLPSILAVLGLLLVVLALARPARRVAVSRTTEGIDILLCLDTSSSMASTDMDGERTRLEVAKEAAGRFIEGRPDDRIGLVTFARFPDLACPLTLDHEALRKLLGGISLVENDGPEDATGIGTAVCSAARVLGGGEAESKVVILLTDGEENVATADKPGEIAPLHAGQLCRDMGVRVHAVVAGLGSRDRSGSLTPLDTSQVKALAEKTDGRFFTARDAGAVAGVYAEIDRLTRAEIAETRYRTVDGFLPFLAAALALLLLGRVLESRVLAVAP